MISISLLHPLSLLEQGPVKDHSSLWYILTRMQMLLDYYGPIVQLIFMNFPYCYAILALSLWNVTLKNISNVNTTTADVSKDIPVLTLILSFY